MPGLARQKTGTIALTFLPADALGPIVERVQLLAGESGNAPSDWIIRTAAAVRVQRRVI